MMVRTTFFTGGISDPVKAIHASDLGLNHASLPMVASIPLLQHQGSPAVAMVTRGQEVREGECIARSPDDTGAHVFSSIPGTVLDVADYARPDGSVCQTVLVELGGSFPVSTSLIPDESWKLMESRRIVDMIRDKGIIDLGRSCRPLHTMLRGDGGFSILRVVVNAVQPEPWQSVPAWCLLNRGPDLIEALGILRQILGAVETFVAASEHFSAEFHGFMKLASALPAVHGRLLENRYPQAEDRYLFQALFGEDLPAGQTALDHHTLVLDPETLLALRDAVVLGRPHMDRLVMVAGSAVAKPGIFRVRMGTPVSMVLQEAGGTAASLQRVIAGGAMHGCSIPDTNIPVTRDMPMILALDHGETQDSTPRDCIRCGLCIQTCPAALEPIRLVRLVGNGLKKEAVQEGLMECSDCGICSHVCPSRLALGTVLREAKGLPRLPGSWGGEAKPEVIADNAKEARL